MTFYYYSICSIDKLTASLTILLMADAGRFKSSGFSAIFNVVLYKEQ